VANRILALGPLALVLGLAQPAAAASGVWSSDLSEAGMCSVGASFPHGGKFFTAYFAFKPGPDARVRFSMWELSDPNYAHGQATIESPSLAAPWVVTPDNQDIMGPEVEALRAGLLRGDSWLFSVKPVKGKAKDIIRIEPAPSNTRTQMGMFEACVRANSRALPALDGAEEAVLSAARAEPALCELVVTYDTGGGVRLLLSARRESFGIVAAMNAEPGAQWEVDLAPFGGSRASFAQGISQPVAPGARAAVLEKFAGGEPVRLAMKSKSGESKFLAIGAGQSAIDAAMFAGCVAALPGPPAITNAGG